MIINDITKNNDAAFFSSCYLNFSRTGKIKMGPIWDFDISCGNVYYNNNFSYEGAHMTSRVAWYKRMIADPVFVERLKQRYAVYYSNKDCILDYIDSQADIIRNAAIANDDTWHTFGIYVWPNYVYFDTYQEEVDYLKDWVSHRLDWLNKFYNKL